MNLRELLSVVRRNWLTVAGLALVVAGIATGLSYSAAPSFRARAVIRLANSRSSMAGSLATESNVQTTTTTTDPLKSQIQVLTSRTVASTVVDSESALLRVTTSGFPIVLLAHMVVSPGASVDSVNLDFLPSEIAASSGAERRRVAYGAPIEFRGIGFSVAQRPAVPSGVVRIRSRDAATSALVSGIKATQRPESDVFDVDYTASDPLATQRIVNTLVKVFASSSTETTRQRSKLRRDFIGQQLAQNDSLETKAQNELSAFRSREHMFSGKDKFADQQHDVVNLNLQRGGLTSDRDVAQSLLAGMTSSKGPERARALRTLVSTPGIVANPVIAGLYDQLTRFRSTHDSMTTGRFASANSNPDVQRLDTLIASTENQLADAVQSHIGSLNAKIAVLDQALARSTTSLDLLPSAAAEELRLSSQVETIHKVGDQLREEYQKAKITEAVQGGDVEIVDLAGRSASMTGARGPKLLIGLLVGLVLGIGAAFVREHLNTTIKRRADIERLLRLASVGVIPSIATTPVRHSRSNRKADKTPPAAKSGTREIKFDRDKKGNLSRSAQKEAIRASLGIEAFASLRTNMLYLPNGVAMKMVVVTSCAPKDGKSTVSANIAEAYARSGARVLLVDCDLRRPRLHEVFGEVVEVGLTEVLLGTIKLETAMRPVAGNISLTLLTAGSRVGFPSELIGSESMDELLKQLSGRFDLVVLDSPPVLVVSDAAILATKADGVLFVVRAGTTEPAAARAALSQLDAVGANVIGAVLNDPDDRLPQYDSGYYYSYYNDYFTQSAG